MTDSIALIGLKSIAKYLDVSVPKTRKFIKMGLPVFRDKSGMYHTTTISIDEWFYKSSFKKFVKTGKKP